MSIQQWILGGSPWRGLDGEDKMTDDDWMRRAHDQAMAMREGGDAFDSSPDEDGCPTGGNYNNDYPESWHDKLNKRLKDDEYYEAIVSDQVRKLFGSPKGKK